AAVWDTAGAGAGGGGARPGGGLCGRLGGEAVPAPQAVPRGAAEPGATPPARRGLRPRPLRRPARRPPPDGADRPARPAPPPLARIASGAEGEAASRSPKTTARDREAALQLLGDLRRATTPTGLLPERVSARTGLPTSTTPLAWSEAFAVLSLRQLWPATRGP